MIELNEEEHGFNGVYFEGNRFLNFVIFRVSGSGATKQQVISSSQFLIDAGFNVMCIGMYLWDTTDKDASEIPVDYVENAMTWIRNYTSNPDIHFGMTGLSLGALYTLICASHISDIEAIAVASPFDYCMEGNTSDYKATGHSTFVYHNQELPYTKWNVLRQGLLKVVLGAIKDKRYGFSRILRYAYDSNGVEEQSRIHVEKMNAHILMLASKDDDCWPSEQAVQRIEERLTQSNYPYTIQSYIYEKGCHNMGGNMTVTGKTGKKMRRLMRAWKDHPQECLECIKDSQKRILDFFQTYCSNDELSI